MIEFLGGECIRCGLKDVRGLVIAQTLEEPHKTNQLYTLVLHEPELARAALRVLCATCRQIERAAHHPDASPECQPSPSPPDQPSDASPSDHSSSERTSRGGGFLAGGADVPSDGVAFGSDF